MTELDVHLGTDQVGVLAHDPQTNLYEFRYAADWLRREDRFPLSAFIPLEPAARMSADERSRNIRQFFENLLPEGESLDTAAAAAKVSKHSVIGLLAMLGRESAGALRIRSSAGDDNSTQSARRPLAPEELSERIRARPEQPFSVWDGKVRLSIAGHQDKLAVYQENAQWWLVDANTLASTHLLKPEPLNSALAGLTSNEFFCMRLAVQAGIPTAAVELQKLPEPVLQITRFDRQIRPWGVERIHMIDGCQALGLAVDAKYERLYGSGRDVRHIRDGASLPRLFSMLNSASRPLLERRALLRWAIFQVLVGNPDAHAKNLSFYSSVQGLSLAPAYDLISVYALNREKIEDTYAMAIGDAFTAQELSPYEWASFARQCDLPRRFVSTELATICGQVKDQLRSVANAVIEQGARPDTVERIAAATAAECDRQIPMAARIARVSSD